jgi:hypothetical protein
VSFPPYKRQKRRMRHHKKSILQKNLLRSRQTLVRARTLYVPRAASPLACARANRNFCAASTFSFFPSHALRQDCWRARPYEKVSFHGRAPRSSAFIALRCTEASSSDWPPERKVMPGTAGGTERWRAVTVAVATSLGEIVLCSGCPESDEGDNQHVT